MKVLLILVCLFASSAYGKPFFQDCKTALADQPFHLLAQNQENLKLIIAANASTPNLGQCFRLNDHEFLIIPETTQATSGSMYYCNFKHYRGCKPYQYKEQLPSIAIVKEFDGGRKKHFALLSTDFLEHGYSGRDYFVLYLSKHKGQSFTFQHLVGVNGVRGGLCGEDDDKPMGGWEPDVTSDFPEKNEYRIKHAGKSSITLEFNVVTKNCKNSQKAKYQDRFVFRQGAFVKIHRAR